MTTPKDVARIIRVNQAGEAGAVQIYRGQKRALAGQAEVPLIEHMLAQEETHLERFNEMMADRQVRPTAFSPAWHVLGYALGYITGRLGPKAAMACTEAVEEVIDAHYSAQEDKLGSQEEDLKTLIQTCRAEEAEHHALSIAQGAHEAPAYPLLSGAVKRASRLAIWLSEKI